MVNVNGWENNNSNVAIRTANTNVYYLLHEEDKNFSEHLHEVDEKVQ